MMSDGWMGGGWPFGGLLWLPISALAVYGLIQVLRTHCAGNHTESSTGSSVLDALDERFTKSRIDQNENLHRKHGILGKGDA